MLAILVAGTAGYMMIEGWSVLDSVWMVLITVTTIGFGEVHTLSDGGRAFTMLLIVGGLSLGGYTASQFTRYVVEGGLRHDLRERTRRKRVEKLHDHYIVIGHGRLGAEVALDLRHEGQTVVVIDPDAEATKGLDDTGIVVIVGDGSSDEVLRRARIDAARGLAVATPSSAVNVYVTLSARQLAPHLPILTRADDADAVPKARRAGATDVISPYGISGNRMARSLLHPTSTSFLDQAVARHHGHLSLEDVLIGTNPKHHGRLRDLHLRQDYSVLVVAIRKPDSELETAPDANVVIEQGDVVVVVGAPKDISRFARDATVH
ncbi:MAG: potassium channel protein [Proteobacteria bacterium]|nr:potassium channel protein [Pseudomonadota bacterium]MCP4921881.1 potassium channel protein [Pseudomonadota bacterium]